MTRIREPSKSRGRTAVTVRTRPSAFTLNWCMHDSQLMSPKVSFSRTPATKTSRSTRWGRASLARESQPPSLDTSTPAQPSGFNSPRCELAAGATQCRFTQRGAALRLWLHCVAQGLDRCERWVIRCGDQGVESHVHWDRWQEAGGGITDGSANRYASRAPRRTVGWQCWEWPHRSSPGSSCTFVDSPSCFRSSLASLQVAYTVWHSDSDFANCTYAVKR